MNGGAPDRSPEVSGTETPHATERDGAVAGPATAGSAAPGDEPSVVDAGGEPAAAEADDKPTVVAAAEDEAPSRGAAIAIYLVCLAVAIGFVLGPLAAFIIWRVRRDEPFLDLHGRQAFDIVLTALLVGGGLFFIGRLVMEAQAAVGSILQWLAIGVVVIQAALLLWGAVIAGRAGTTLLPASLRLLRRRSMV